ncbi:GntR family transcriptional regulator [Treponema sp.]
MWLEDVNTTYGRVYSWLRGEFEANRICIGDRLPSENVLCTQFESSRPPIRQAMARLLHEGLIETQRGRGSFRKAPPASTSKDIALVLPDLSSYIYPELTEAANAALRERDFHTLLECSATDPDAERRILKAMLGRKPAGLIISPVQGDIASDSRDVGNSDLLRELRTQGIAVLLLDNDLGTSDFDSIVINDYKCGRTAMDYLIDKGHSPASIAVVWRPGHAPFAARRRGALDRLTELGKEPATGTELQSDGFSPEKLGPALDAFLVKREPTAFFCVNDDCALTLINLLVLRGIRVPEDVSVLGFDDSPPARSGAFLSSFDYPSTWIGKKAAELMNNLLEPSSITANTRIALNCKLIERASVKDLRKKEHP